VSFGTISNDFESGHTTGTTITAGNSGDGSAGTAFTVVTANGTVTFDSSEVAHGSLAAKIVTGTTGANVFQWGSGVLTGAPTTFYARINLYLPSLPAATFRVAKFEGGSSALIGEVDITTAGKIVFRDAAGTTRYTSTSVIPTGQWVRIEVGITVGSTAGQAEIKLFDSVDSTAATEDATVTSLNLSANGLNFSQIGSTTVLGSSVTFWLDDLAISDSGWVGAVNPTSPPPSTLGTISNDFESGHTTGTTITAGNSGDGSAGSPFQTVTISSGGALTFDSSQAAHGTLAGKYVTGTSGVVVTQWGSAAFAANPTTFYFRANLFIAANPTSIIRVAKFEGGSNALIGELDLGTNGKFGFRDSAGTTQLTLTNAITANAWVRIEGKVVVGSTTGSIELRLFNTLDSVVPTEDDTVSNLNLSTNGINFAQIGSAVTTANSQTFWLDDLAISDSGWIGPAGSAPTGIALGVIVL
jgi:hypothetical protein